MEYITKEMCGNRLVLIPKDGRYVTNGTTYSKYLMLAVGLTEKGYYTITDAEYNAIIKEQEENLV